MLKRIKERIRIRKLEKRLDALNKEIDALVAAHPKIAAAIIMKRGEAVKIDREIQGVQP